MANIIRWFEIPAKDLNRAIDFYTKVFRLKIELVNFNNIPHAILKPQGPGNDEIGGAIVEAKNMPEKSFGPVIYFDANPDMLLIEDRIVENGGKIMLSKTIIKNLSAENNTYIIPKTLIDDRMGYFGFFQDPAGNRMGLYSNS